RYIEAPKIRKLVKIRQPHGTEIHHVIVVKVIPGKLYPDDMILVAIKLAGDAVPGTFGACGAHPSGFDEPVVAIGIEVKLLQRAALNGREAAGHRASTGLIPRALPGRGIPGRAGRTVQAIWTKRRLTCHEIGRR